MFDNCEDSTFPLSSANTGRQSLCSRQRRGLRHDPLNDGQLAAQLVSFLCPRRGELVADEFDTSEVNLVEPGAFVASKISKYGGYHKKSVEIFGLGKQGAAAQDLRLHRRRGRKRERRQGLRRGGKGWRRSFAAQTRGTVRKRGLLLIICFKKFLFVFFTKTFTSSFFKKTKSRCRRSTTHKFRSAKGLRTKKQGSSKKQES